MKRFAIFLAGAACVFAQRPSNPALLVPQEAPALDYVAVANPLPVPDAAAMGASSDVAFDSKGRMVSVQRGPAHVQIGVIGPKGAEATLADDFNGNPNDLVLTKNDGVYFTVPGPLSDAQARGKAKRPCDGGVVVYGIRDRAGPVAT